MGKRRNTAKTGDKGIYKGRNDGKAVSPKGTGDDDAMHTAVDRFHNSREEEFLKLDASPSDSEEEEEQVEAVMDLGVGESSAESSDSEEENDLAQEEEEEAALSSDSDEDEEDGEIEGVRNWGKKKSTYYHGDTADLEIGQEQEDAYLEEEAAKEVEAARYEDMSEDDFVISDDEKDDADEQKGSMVTSSTRDMSKLSAKDRRKLIDRQHPEMLPLLSYFSGAVRELSEKTRVATKAVIEEGGAESVGTSKEGKRFLLTKTLLQSSTALNLAMYLLLKADQPDGEEIDPSLIQSHPIIARLEKLNSLSQRLEKKVETKALSEQLSNLVEAAALLRSGAVEDASEDELQREDHKEGQEDIPADQEIRQDDDSSEQDKASMISPADDERRVLVEARFGLRQSEISSSSSGMKKKKRHVEMDFGDVSTTEESRKAGRALASTLNRIEQKSTSKKRRAAPMADHIDDANEDNEELRRGLAMMEEEFGKDFYKEDGNEGDADIYDAELDDEGEDGDFYNQVAKKTKLRKAERKARYAVAPKFPRVEKEIEGERAISKAILKNRGLVAHKSKLNRNPRVKKREQYRKAIIRRKGAIRDVREDEGHRYGGEETGIKSSISRSRKLAR